MLTVVPAWPTHCAVTKTPVLLLPSAAFLHLRKRKQRRHRVLHLLPAHRPAWLFCQPYVQQRSSFTMTILVYSPYFKKENKLFKVMDFNYIDPSIRTVFSSTVRWSRCAGSFSSPIFFLNPSVESQTAVTTTSSPVQPSSSTSP